MYSSTIESKLTLRISRSVSSVNFNRSIHHSREKIPDSVLEFRREINKLTSDDFLDLRSNSFFDYSRFTKIASMIRGENIYKGIRTLNAPTSCDGTIFVRAIAA